METEFLAAWGECQRVRQLFVEESSGALVMLGRELKRCLEARNRIVIFGSKRLAMVAQYGGKLFRGGGFSDFGTRYDVSAFSERAELEALSGADTLVIWLSSSPADADDANALSQLAHRGAGIVAIAGAPAEFIDSLSHRTLVIPTTRAEIVSDLMVSVLHALYEVVSDVGRARSEAGRRSSNAAPVPASMRPWGPAAGAEDKADSPAQERAASSKERRKSLPTGALNSGELSAGDIVAVVKKPTVRASLQVFKFRCGACRETITIERKYAGKRGQCPYCLAELQIPAPSKADSARSNERRRAMRFSVAGARAFFRLGDRWLDRGETIEDLSLTGCAVRLEILQREDFAGQKELQCALDLPAFSEPLRVKVRLRRSFERKGQLLIGLEFVDLSPEILNKIQRLHENAALRTVKRR